MKRYNLFHIDRNQPNQDNEDIGDKPTQTKVHKTTIAKQEDSNLKFSDPI